MNQSSLPKSLFSDLTRLIAEARTRAAVAVNTEESIVSSLRRQLSWIHIRTIIRPVSVQGNVLTGIGTQRKITMDDARLKEGGNSRYFEEFLAGK